MTLRIIITPKFFDATRLTFSQLAKTPGIGSLCEYVNSSNFL
ncbi:hypothetical protein [Brunnivagina elsteri]|nr:hypothetical protein [Calothrix elsteri]